MPTLSETDLQRESDRLVQREVNCCLSYMVAALASGYANQPSSQWPNSDLPELIEQALELASPVDDYEEAATQAGWTRQAEGWQHAERGVFTTADAQVLCESYEIEPYQREVFEHWAVSTWLAEHLIARGEKVDKDFADLCVWARTTTGHAISMDGVIRAITQEIHNS